MPALKRHILSKSTFLYGNQCLKRLYLYKKRPDLRDEITEEQQAIFDRGTNVGLLARDLFPGGVDASPPNPFQYQKSVQTTESYINEGKKIIYEAAFQQEEVLAAIDVLVKEGRIWQAFEVKSNTEVKEVHVIDAALQYYVITQAGIPLKDISIVHLNNEYIKKGKLNLKQLFSVQSVLDEVLELQDLVKEKIAEFKAMLSKERQPRKDIGPQCFDPYTCDFMGHCWQHIPSPSVFNISGLRINKKFELYESGIIELKDLPRGYKLSAYQELQVNGVVKNKSNINKKAIKEFLGEIPYPLYFMDFETFQSAIPIYDGTRPYQQIPFQYSLHYLKKENAEPEHYEFLGDGKKDPRKDFIEKLLKDTSKPGLVLAYNMSFEKGILSSLAADFPEYEKPIEKLIDRLCDLMVPFKQGDYYLPSMSGSYSIKKVLPALVPELSYDTLRIAEGSAASQAYYDLIFNPVADKENIRKDLLEYCKLDTWAMVKVLQALKKAAGK